MKCGLWFCMFIVLGCSFVDAAKLPPYFKVCSRNDPQFKECATRNGRMVIKDIIHGDRKYGIPDLDPLEITELGLRLNGINLTLKNIKLYGAGETTLQEFNVDFKNHVMSYKSLTPQTVVLADYTVNGKLAVIPVQGQGKANFTLDNMGGDFSLKYDIVKKKDGNEYLSLKDSNLKLTTSRLYTKMENVAGGNKLVGDQVNLFLNENWQEIMRDFGPGIGEGFSAAIKQTLSLLETVPYDEVFPKE